MRFFHRFFLFLVAALIGSPSYLAASYYYGTLVFTESNHILSWAWSSGTDPHLSGAVSFNIVPQLPLEGPDTERWYVGVNGFDLNDLGVSSFDYNHAEGLWREPDLINHYNEVIFGGFASIWIYSDVYRTPSQSSGISFDDGGILPFMFDGHLGGSSGSQAYFGVQFFDLGIATPEPSLLCLLAIGIAGLGIPLWKRKSQSSPN